MLESLFQFAGRMHPMVLHLPIGLMVGLIALECLALARRQPMPPGVRPVLVWLIAATCVFSAASGLILSQEGSYGGTTLDWHKWLGIAVAVAAVLAAMALHVRRAAKAYGALLLTGAALLVPAGHFGAAMTHGDGFLTAPFRDSARRLAPPPRLAADSSSAGTGSADLSVYATQIAPILEHYCVSCHGESTRKGKLALHTPEAIMAGGSTGSAIELGDSAASEMIFRLRMHIEEDGRMPPKSKPQPDAAAIAVLAAWIDAGASFEQGPSSAGATRGASPGDAAPPRGVPARPAPLSPPAPAVAALRAAHVHVETIDPATGLLWVSFAAVPMADDASVQTLLEPLAPFIGELSLARTRITNQSLQLVAGMPRLSRLSIAHTACTVDGLASLEQLASLEVLSLAGTRMDDSAAALISTGFSSLEQLFVWNSGIGPESIDLLRGLRPEMHIDTGDSASLVLAEEPAPSFSSDAPPPGAPAGTGPGAHGPSTSAASAEALRPVNTLCPVAGKPIDDRFALVHKGRVVAFCCADCLAAFLADPARFEPAIR